MHLVTARLTLRALSLDDLDFVAVVADPVVMRYYPKLLSRIEALGWSLPGLITWCSASGAGTRLTGRTAHALRA
jgi:hypothetical protein